MKRHRILIAFAVILTSASALAVTDAQLKSIKKAISSVPVPELPAKAAEVVTQAAKPDREVVAVAAVRAAIYKSRASAPLVVAAICKAAPEVAAPVSRAAAEMEAGQSARIAAAATSAAPHAKTEIASSVQQGARIGNSFSPAGSSSDAGDSTSVFTTRGSAARGHHGKVEHRNRPINENRGGNGNGRFPEHPPHRGNPPGHDPDHHGKPDFVDYTKPRRF